MSDDEFRQQFHDSLKEFAGVEKPDEVSTALARRPRLHPGEMDDPALYQRVATSWRRCAAADGVLFYLAIPPTVYGTVVEQLGAAGLTTAGDAATAGAGSSSRSRSAPTSPAPAS